MVAQVFHANLADIDQTPQMLLGVIYELDNKRYKYVQFSGTTTINAFDVVCYVAAGSDGLEVIVDKANTALGAGVSINAVPSGAVAYGWILITGLTQVSTAPAGSPAFGDNLTTAGAAGGAHTKNAASNTQITANYYGVVNTLNMIVAEFPN